MSLTVNITRGSDTSPELISVDKMENGQLFLTTDDEVGMKVQHGWLVFDHDNITPFVWEELDENGSEYRDCKPISGSVTVKVHLEKSDENC